MEPLTVHAFIGQAAYRLFLALHAAPGRAATWLRRFCNRVRYFLIRKSDPVVRMPASGEPLYMNLSHQLPLYQKVHPLYDRVLPRVAGRIAEEAGDVMLLDVGANIGDTAVAVLNAAAGRCLCVEGDAAYFPLLVRNTARYRDQVECLFALCTSGDSQGPVAAIRGGGTTRFAASQSGADSPPLLTVDDIVARHRHAERTNLFKIDTEGFDFKVLRGAEGLLHSARPMLFFELHPALLQEQGEDPLSIFPWLAARGYEDMILYDNAGNPALACRTTDAATITAALSRIDCDRIHYFDVLAVHHLAPPALVASFTAERREATL